MKLSFAAILLPLCLVSTSPLPAFTLTSLHSFAIAPRGAQPRGTLLPGPNGVLYGTTEYGGTNGGGGTVFNISTNGLVKTLHFFAGYDDGYEPMAGVVRDAGGSVYGTSAYGGASGNGTAFKLEGEGKFSVLYNFGTLTNSSGRALDGAHPSGELALEGDGNFYGTTARGGEFDQGTVFHISTNGILTTLYSFGTISDAGGNALDGANPAAGLVQGADGSFYGTTSRGGVNDLMYGGDGTVFQITRDGTLTTLYSFNDSDGSSPDASLVQAPDGSLYGTTSTGGPSFSGTIFQITTNGLLTTLYSFRGGDDGSYPEAALLLANDGNLYGTTSEDGANYEGTLFKLTPAGAFSTLVQFGGLIGAAPMAGLVQTADGNLYGTTERGGANGIGVVFRVTTGGYLTVLFSFPQTNDGANPSADLVLARDGNFYGTTEAGGDYSYGTVFRMSPAGNLTLLYTFGSVSNLFGDPLDGADSEGTLLQGQDGSLYGTTPSGGPSWDGTIYQITTNGVFNLLYTLSGSDGSTPWGGLVQTADGVLYGTTSWGGASDHGELFSITTNGVFMPLYSFSGFDGDSPYASLAVGPDGLLYGTTCYGGGSDLGTVFQCDTNGNLSTLYSFSGTDGGEPQATLRFGADGALYGTTATGGASDQGTVFRLTTNGTLTTLAQFGGTNGAHPLAGVVQTGDGRIYGTTSEGGIGNNGVVFQIGTNGVLNWLALDGITGSYPDSGVVMGPDGNLYTLSEYGGLGGYGNIFRVDIVAASPVVQKIVRAGNSVILTSSAVATRSYQLQFKTNLAQATWNNLGAACPATNDTLQICDTPGGDARRFYRVVLLP